VDQLSLTVNRGQVLGLLGPNGAGKTTAMNLITADFAPTSGRVRDLRVFSKKSYIVDFKIFKI